MKQITTGVLCFILGITFTYIYETEKVMNALNDNPNISLLAYMMSPHVTILEHKEIILK